MNYASRLHGGPNRYYRADGFRVVALYRRPKSAISMVRRAASVCAPTLLSSFDASLLRRDSRINLNKGAMV